MPRSCSGESRTSLRCHAPERSPAGYVREKQNGIALELDVQAHCFPALHQCDGRADHAPPRVVCSANTATDSNRHGQVSRRPEFRSR
eukprot:3299288-Rhodomonas_salina.1